MADRSEAAPALVVPVVLRALCVGEGDVAGDRGTSRFAQIGPDFSRMPYVNSQNRGVNVGPNISDTILAEPFERASSPLEPGVHLHWALPEALARRKIRENGSAENVPAPNRWLVVRNATNRAAPAQPTNRLDAWVVESDRLWDPGRDPEPLPTNDLSRPYPVMPLPDPIKSPNKPFRTIGRTFRYETWSEDATAQRARPFTAFGYGDPAFAAAYPLAPNCFGMYDPLFDLDLVAYPPAATALSYVVVGWYSSTGDDPVAGAASKAAGDELRMLLERDLGWTYATAAGAADPVRVLCNGILTGVRWDPRAGYFTETSSHSVDVAIGNTTAEALSALLSTKPPLAGVPGAEAALNALQLGRLSTILEPDGPIELEEAMHGASFASTSGGLVWSARPRNAGERGGDGVGVSTQGLLDAASSKAAPFPPGAGEALDALNAAQARLDRLAAELESAQSQVFADWWKHLFLQWSPRRSAAAGKVYDYLSKKLVPALSGAAAEVESSKKTRDDAAASLRDLVGDGYVVESAPAPSFWSPADPVVLLCGPDLTARYRPAAPDSYESGNLVCRLSTELVSGLMIDAPERSVTAAQLPTLPPSAEPALPREVDAFVGEAFLVDPAHASVVGRIVGDIPAPPAWERIADAQRRHGENGSSVTFAGIFPTRLGVQTWDRPWTPLLLEWEVQYYPLVPVDDGNDTATAYPEDLATEFAFDALDVDLVARHRPPERMPRVQIYTGSTLLTGNTEVNVRAAIDAYVGDHPDDEYVEALKAVELGPPAMAQALGGLHSALLMRRQVLQLPVADPLAMTTSGLMAKFANRTLPAALGLSNTTSPLPDATYNPLRAGYMHVSRVWIVDVFGQVREITPAPEDVVTAAALRPAGEDPERPVIGFPLRIVQPSRLTLRLQPAAHDVAETNADPATTPIVGWVDCNHLADSLTVYEGDGTLHGSLNTTGPLWTNAPGASYAAPLSDALLDMNPHLARFVRGITEAADPVAYLTEILEAVDATLELVDPAAATQYRALSVLTGRPLALVRATVDLELRGLPASNQSWAELTAAVDRSAQLPDRDIAGFTSVTVPVQLGNLGKIEDGLIGFFLDDGSAGAFRTFFCHGATATGHGVELPAPDLLKVSAAGEPIQVSMLVDPVAPVHATCGVVPVQQVQVPPSLVADALARMQTTFLTAPVLTTATAFGGPVPNEDGYEWSWLSVDPATKQWTSSVIAPAADAVSAFPTHRAVEGWLELSRPRKKTTPDGGTT